MSSAKSAGSGHIRALDAVRGIAILLVLICHYSLPLVDQFDTRAGRVFFSLLGATRHGVDLFFVLSGFLITGILLSSRDRPGYFRNFIARRTLRIFPLYYAVLVATLLIAPRVITFPASDLDEIARDQWSLWTYTSNILMFHSDRWLFQWKWFDLSHFWSLAVEEQFYLAWPLIVLALSPRWLGRLCVALFLGAAILRGVLVYRGVSPMAVSLFTLCRIDSLAAGALLAVLHRRPQGLAPLAKYAPYVGALLVPCLAITFAMASGNAVLVQSLKYALLALFFSCFVIIAVTTQPGSTMERIISRPTLIFLGKYSYGIYVYHDLFRPTFIHYFGPERFVEWLHAPFLAAWVLYALLAATVTIAISYVSYHVYERHFLKLKRYFEPR